MRQNAKQIDGCSDAIDIVGTGGDMSNTFNISTTSSFVIAAAGAKVAKHGNRSVSSRSGAADVLESLGVKITSTPEKAKQLIDSVGLSFLFAQSYHSSMKYVANARRETGIRTIFNILGPLSNPASTDYILLELFNPNLLEPLANVLINLNIKRAMLVYGNDKLDEISISASTSVVEINGKEIKKYEINPFDFGMQLAEKSEIEGGESNENAEITKTIFKWYTSVIGQVLPSRMIYLDAIEGGRVEERLHEEGAMVKKGDVILRLSNPLLNIGIMQSEADLAYQENELRNTRISMEQERLSLKQDRIGIQKEFIIKKRRYGQYKRSDGGAIDSEGGLFQATEEYEAVKEQLLVLDERIRQDSLFRLTQISSLTRI